MQRQVRLNWAAAAMGLVLFWGTMGAMPVPSSSSRGRTDHRIDSPSVGESWRSSTA